MPAWATSVTQERWSAGSSRNHGSSRPCARRSAWRAAPAACSMRRIGLVGDARAAQGSAVPAAASASSMQAGPLRATGMSQSDAADPVADLRRIAFLLDGRASRLASRRSAPLRRVAESGRGRAGRTRRAGHLAELAGIGEVTARCLDESLACEKPGYLRRLAGGRPTGRRGGRCASGRVAR